jgi:hypothetical protein
VLLRWVRSLEELRRGLAFCEAARDPIVSLVAIDFPGRPARIDIS